MSYELAEMKIFTAESDMINVPKEWNREHQMFKRTIMLERTQTSSQQIPYSMKISCAGINPGVLSLVYWGKLLRESFPFDRLVKSDAIMTIVFEIVNL